MLDLDILSIQQSALFPREFNSPAMEADNLPGDPAMQQNSPSNEVPWQSIFMMLLGLAFANMTQPCGKVLGQSAHLGCWLRSSPIVSLADAILLLTNIIRAARHEQSLANGALTVLESRLELTHEEEWYGFRSLEKKTLVRWLLVVPLFVYTSLKLFGYKGVPISQTVGYAYVLSFVILELCLAIPLLFQRTRRTIVSDFPFENERRNRQRWDTQAQSAQGLRYIQDTTANLCRDLQKLFSVSIIGIMMGRLEPAMPSVRATVVVFILYMVYCLAVVIYLPFIMFGENPRRVMSTLVWPVFWCWLFIGGTWIYFTAGHLNPYCAVPLYLILCMLCHLGLRLVFPQRGSSLGLLLLGVKRELEEPMFFLHSEHILTALPPSMMLRLCWPIPFTNWEAALDAFGQFLRLLLISILWFKFGYDSTNTSKSWTDSLG